jgi:hypothetical protein
MVEGAGDLQRLKGIFARDLDKLTDRATKVLRNSIRDAHDTAKREVFDDGLCVT